MQKKSENPPEKWESAFAKVLFFKEDPSSLLVFGKEIIIYYTTLFIIYLSGKKPTQKNESVKSWVDFFVKATPPAIDQFTP